MVGRKLLFTTMIQPHFLYCIEVWRCSNQTLNGSVEILYRHCLRIMLNDVGYMPALNNRAVYFAAGLSPLCVEFQHRCACLVYAIAKLNTVANLHGIFHCRVNMRVTRESDDSLALRVPFTRTERERTAVYCGIAFQRTSARPQVWGYFAMLTRSISYGS
jgi:hypothetical protein